MDITEISLIFIHVYHCHVLIILIYNCMILYRLLLLMFLVLKLGILLQYFIIGTYTVCHWSLNDNSSTLVFKVYFSIL